MSTNSYDDLLIALEARATDHGSAIALVDGDRVVTYRQLWAAAHAVTTGLRARDLDAGARVGLCARRGADTVAAMLGILTAGAAFVPLDPADPAERLAAVARGAGVTTVLAPGTAHAPFRAAGLHCLDTALLCVTESAIAPVVSVHPAGPAYVIHTSGTTGTPKGVGVPYRALSHFSRVIAEGYGLGPGDRVFQFSSIAFDGSIEEIFPPLYAGATMVIRAEAPVPPPAPLLDWCATAGLTVLHLPTAYWHECVDALAAGDAALPAGVRIVSVGGEEMRADRLRRWRTLGLDEVRLVNVYGPTETTVVATWDDLAGPRAGAHADGAGPGIGRPVSGVSVEVIDAEGSPVGIGGTGELWIGGPGVALGYLGMPGLTSQRFVPGPDGSVYYRTGDRVRREPHGRLGYLGRMDRQLKVRGFRVEPAEIERALCAQPQVRDAVVHYDPERGTLVGYLVPAAADIVAAEILDRLADLLPAHAVPSRLVAVPAFPLTPRGAKVDRAALAEMFGTATESADIEPDRTDTTARIATLAAEVLGLPTVDVDVSIFALGAHSLTAIRLLTRITRDFAVTLDLADLHTAATPAGIAKLVDAGAGEPVSPGAPVDGPATGLSLTGFQRDCWLAEQLRPELPMYTLGLRYRVSGPTAAEDIVSALTHLVERHEALRMTVRETDRGPELVARPTFQVPVTVHDLTELTPAQRPSRITELAAQRGRTVMDPRTGPLLAATLLRLDRAEWELVVAVHHLAFDGWSAAVLANDLAAVLAGDELPVAIGFSDHLRDSAAPRTDTVRHWIDRLTGVDTEIELPADRPRPAVRTFTGGRIHRPLDPGLLARIESVATETGTTSAAFLLAALQTLITRLTGRTDVTVLMPTAHRTDPAHDGTIGAFINVLPLRTDLSGGPDFRTVLRRSGESLLAALGRQDLPFAELLAALPIPHRANRSPLSQVMLIVVNTPVAAAVRGGITVEHLGDTGNGTAQLDLTVTLDLPRSGPTLSLEYATDLFDTASATRLLDYLLVLIEAAVADPGHAIAELPLLSASARAEILAHAGTAGPAPGNHILRAFAEHVESTPDAPAVTCAAVTRSYRELDSEADRMAGLLAEHSVRRGDHVGICLRRGISAVTAVLACWKRGAAFVPLDPDYPAERLRHMITDSGIAVVLTESGDTPLPSEVRAVPCDIPATPGAAISPRPGDAAYLVYTSGSTGLPKGVVVTHGNVAHALAMWRTEFQLGTGWSHLQAAALSFDVFLGDLVRALGTGGRLVICPRETLLDPPALYDLMRRERIDVAELAPAVLRRLIQDPGVDLSFLRLLIGGADVWYPHEYRRAQRAVGPNGRVLNTYGVTEVTVDSTAYESPCGTDAETPAMSPLPIGRPLAGNRIYVLDGRGDPAPPGVPGELWLGGAGVAIGYHGRPGLTAERFRPDPFAGIAGARMYRTGDLARLRADGILEFLGRLDDQVKLHGHRIELAEVEAALVTLPGVRAAAAAVRVDGRGVPRLIGYLAPESAAGTTAEIRSALGKLLPHFAVPTRIVRLPELPLGPNGKVDRAALPQPPEQSAAADPEPASALERELAEIWAEVLDRPAVGLDDGLFELGGDSFTALRLIRAMEQRRGLRVALLELYRHPTVRALAAQLSRAGHTEGAADRLLHRFGSGTTTPVATVIAIPYSGGQAVAFEPLAAALPGDWALYALQPPGRDRSRPDESALPFDELVGRCLDELRALPGPLYLYGHCHGAATTIALAYRAEAAGLSLAGVAIGALFPMARLPGRLSDWLHRTLPMDRLVSDRAILEEIRALGGGIGELTDPDERAFVVRAIRHDERGSENYFARTYAEPRPRRLRAPLLSVVGAKDRVTELYTERYREWEHYAERVDLEVIPKAGHGFLKNQTQPLADILVRWAGRAGARTEPTLPDTPGPRPSLRRFAAVGISQFGSQVGSSLSHLVLSLWAYQQTGRITEFAYVMAIALLPAILLGPIAGAVADRYDRRSVMLGCDLVSGLAVAGMAAAMYTGSTGIGQIYALCALTSIAAAFHRPAFLAAIAQLVPKPFLGQANGLSQLGVGAGALFTPMLGAGLLSVVPLQTILLADAITFAAAAGTLLVVRFPDRLFKRREETVRAQIANGWRYVLRRPGLVAMLRFFVVDHLLYATGFALITPLVLIEYGVGTLGFVLAAGGLGALTGSLIMGIWGGTARRTDGMLLFMAANNLGLVLIGLAGAPWLIAAGMFGMAFTESLINGHWIALVQRKVGLELQGRVLALFITVVTVAMPLSYLITGPLADRVFRPMLQRDGVLAATLGPVLGTGPGRGLALVMVVCGILLTGWTALAWRNRQLRFVEDALPDAVPDSEIEDADTEQRRADARLRTAEAAPTGADRQWVHNWRRLYDSAYTGSWDVIGEDFTGWNSSYDDTPIPLAQMREWRAAAVRRILALRPRRVLEIGVGSGNILAHVAPHCAQYVGTDLSEVAIDHLRTRVAGVGALRDRVELHACPADELDFPPESFDTIVLNSVVQYFPSRAYLDEVLERALRLLTPGGALFLGDVRNLRLHRDFGTAVQRRRLAPGTSPAELRDAVDRMIDSENELLVDPAYFVELGARTTHRTGVDIQLEQAPAHNELTAYRYDVVLTKAPARVVSFAETPTRYWGVDVADIAGLARLFAGTTTALRVTAIPNRRVLDQQPAGVPDPETIRRLGEKHGYTVVLTWSGADPHHLDAIAHRTTDTTLTDLYRPPTPPTGDPLVNDPAHTFAR